MSSNIWTVFGRLCAEPEIKWFDGKNGKDPYCVGQFRIAVDRNYRDAGEEKPGVDFFQVRIFGRDAEAMEKYGFKGQRVFVTGCARVEEWKDKTTKENRSMVVLRASSVRIIDWPERDGDETKPANDDGDFQDPFRDQ